MLLAGTNYRAQIQADIQPFEGILLGVFFMTAGASLDPGLCIAEWPTVLAGVAGLVLIKAAALFVGAAGSSLSLAESARVALLIAGGGEFAFVVFKLAEDLEVLPVEVAKVRPTPPLHLPTSPLYLPCISPASPRRGRGAQGSGSGSG